MNYVVLDTDVASLSFKRRLPPPVFAKLLGTEPFITFVTLAELTQWAELRQWGARNRQALEHWINGVGILPYNEQVARTWGRISAAAHTRGRPRPANDTWIAACAITHQLPLATLNIKNFADYVDYESLTIISNEDLDAK